MFTTSEGYNPKACDMWSIGICLYTYLLGEMPFFSATLSEIEIDIQAKNKILEYPVYFSDDLKDLLSKLLNKEYEKRISIEEYMTHPWFSSQ